MSNWIHINSPNEAGEGLHIFANGEDWYRAPIGSKPQKGYEILKCTYCSKPVVQVDQYYPYKNERNQCEDHLEEDLDL